MARSAVIINDPYLADVYYLSNTTIVVTKLEDRTALLELLPEHLIAKSAPIYRRARVLLTVLKALVDRAYADVRADRNDVNAGMILAAGALMGLVTEPPGAYECKPSDMTRKASASSKATRQILAGQWMIPPIGGERQFRSHQKECLDAFRHALLDWFADEHAVRNLAIQVASQEVERVRRNDTERHGLHSEAEAIIPKAIVVQNKYATGPASLLEDRTYAYLSTSPEPYCAERGCKVDGTDMKSGAMLVVTCWCEGAEMTNRDTTFPRHRTESAWDYFHALVLGGVAGWTSGVSVRGLC